MQETVAGVTVSASKPSRSRARQNRDGSRSATRPLVSKTLAEAVRERLMRSIANGELRPGERLNEARLAESFAISRGPIREAARELEGQGFLFSRANQGFYVATVTPDQIFDIYEAKDWLEDAFIADLAAHTDVAARKSVLADIAAIDPSDAVAFSETLFRFRLRMLRHIRNRFLADMMIALYRKFYVLAAVVDMTRAAPRQTRILSVLSRFWTAMADDDIAGARAIMRDDTAYWLAELPSRGAAQG